MTEHARRELEMDPRALPLVRGTFGHHVRQVQEWLCLHDFHTAIDAVFGPATEAALRKFQRHMAEENVVGREEWITGAVDVRTWAALTEPMRRVVEWRPHKGASAGHNIVDCAHVHLAAHPREVGKPNGGPWIRGLYMDGHEGKDWPWCAGFATYVLRQALGHDKWRTFSCDELAIRATAEGHMLWGHRMEGRKPRPGDLFLIRRGPSDWIHCGIVTAVGADYFETSEGNTNVDGSREGTAVCKRVRAFNDRTDFVLTEER